MCYNKEYYYIIIIRMIPEGNPEAVPLFGHPNNNK